MTDLAAWAPAVTEPPPISTPRVELPLPVLVHVEQALRAPEPERAEAATRLNEVLARMATGDGGRQVADTLHQLLGGGRLEGLVDAQGRSCRAVAVEALLCLGFPYALEVEPDDLKHLRANKAMHSSGPRMALDIGRGVPAIVFGAGVVAQVVEEVLRKGPVEDGVTVQVGLSALAMLALWLAPPGTPVYRVGFSLLALVAGCGLLLALGSTGISGGVWVGVAAMVAALLAALRKG
ncbi:hypothetical protein LZ198_24350 [Myxococcus sp. K15C18031901]|uniref:hypothetical protein n=1 Tax=Myxococcus dinghuensis TaxID=2906761 RepID=UPI0020A7A8A1|nr:hypothetical protein [Myxococcus dinghuensis]MCP3102002.1 hypothetical protein [Myxococcus dinghuensis]